jgi:ribosome assembly protein YihI (activator of Der GTPase)
MRRIKCNEQMARSDFQIDKWQTRSDVERRADQDKRRKNSRKYFINGGQERRNGRERRCAEERRDKWMRVGRWRSVPVFDE